MKNVHSLNHSTNIYEALYLGKVLSQALGMSGVLWKDDCRACFRAQ